MTLSSELITIRRLALPVVATQLAAMMLGVVDTMMLGHYNTDALAASSIARVWVFGTLIVAQGILLGLDPIISQAHGKGETHGIGVSTQAGILLALLLSVPLGFAWMFTESVLRWMGMDQGLCLLAGDYAIAQLPGLPFYLLFSVQRSWLQGRGIMRPAMWTVIIANGFNALANWALIFGHLGFEERGVLGAGYATAFTQILCFVFLFFFIRRFDLQKDAWCAWSREALGEIRKILKLGIPIGMQFGFEVWAFQIATLMAAKLGTMELAGHAIAMNLASITFMVPLGISIGASTRVGNLIGARKFHTAQVATKAAMILGVSVMTVAALALSIGREWLPQLYNDAPGVLAAAAAILPIAAAFQLFDGLQVVASGVLRGMGRTRVLALAHFVAFYFLGLPLAQYLAFSKGWGLPGIWWGLCLGLGIAAVGLSLWVLRRGPASMELEKLH
ncbi:MAG: MATE family multidrug resistance protein [Planctomycetota bacterium]|jgi:MATE family multidrug resistance protein